MRLSWGLRRLLQSAKTSIWRSWVKENFVRNTYAFNLRRLSDVLL